MGIREKRFLLLLIPCDAKNFCQNADMQFLKCDLSLHTVGKCCKTISLSKHQKTRAISIRTSAQLDHHLTPTPTSLASHQLSHLIVHLRAGLQEDVGGTFSLLFPLLPSSSLSIALFLIAHSAAKHSNAAHSFSTPGACELAFL